MSDANDNENRPGGRAPLTLKPRGGAVSSGTVKQSFSHGRSKTVVVETKRRRVDAPPPVVAAPARPAFEGPKPPSQAPAPPAARGVPPRDRGARGGRPAGDASAGSGRQSAGADAAALETAAVPAP